VIYPKSKVTVTALTVTTEITEEDEGYPRTLEVRLRRRIARPDLDHGQEQGRFEHRVFRGAVGRAAWRCGSVGRLRADA